jgi:2-keto-4-pentenoate hydratase/2-oxohepta-3-ene-1,7-dioic acid hydratase in catechol pathway
VGEGVVKVVSYRQAGRHGVGVVTGANGLIALSKVAPDLPDDLRKILEIDPTLAKVRAATAGKSADLTLDDIAFDPVIRKPHATWALALNYKLHIEETGLTTSQTYPQIFLRMPICQVGHKQPLWAPRKNIAEAYDYEGELAAWFADDLNGIERQNAKISGLLHDVPRLIEYLSEGYTLQPGDVIVTGSPGALPLRPSEAPEKPVGKVIVAGQLHKRPGDVCEVEVDGLGVLSNPVIEDPTPLR